MINIKEQKRIKSAADAIAQAVGKQKEPIIEEVFKRNDVEAEAITLLLNPMVTFGVKEKSIRKPIDKEPSKQFDSMIDLCIWLSKKKGVSDCDIAAVQDFINRTRAEDTQLAEYAIRFITKSLTLGATEKTVNKVMGCEVIPEFKCMQANKYYEHERYVDGKDFTLTLKMDGIRCMCIANGQDVEFYTRQGQKIEGMIELEHAIRMLNRCCVFDGELLIDGGLQMESKTAYKLTTKIVRKDGEKRGITFHIFDVLNLIEYHDQKGYFSYKERREQLGKIRLTMVGREYAHHLRIVPILYKGNDPKKIQQVLDEVRAENQEGVMINIDSAPYQFKRTNDLLKVKVMQDADLLITGVQEGTGKFKGTLGSLVVEYKGNPVGVGSGLTDEMRNLVWSNPDEYIGRVATIQYFEETKDKDGKLSIRFPVFKELRDIGKEVSYQ